MFSTNQSIYNSWETTFFWEPEGSLANHFSWLMYSTLRENLKHFKQPRSGQAFWKLSGVQNVKNIANLFPVKGFGGSEGGGERGRCFM